MKPSLLIVLSMLLAQNWLCEAVGWTAQSYPNPVTNASACNQPKSSHVCDPDNILTLQQRTDLDTKLLNLKRETVRTQLTGCPREGLTGYIVVLKRIEVAGTGKATPAQMKQFSEQLLRRYEHEVSSSHSHGCNKTFLYVISTMDKQTRIEPEPNVGIASNQLTQIVFTRRKYLLRAKQWYQAFREAIPELMAEYRRNHNVDGDSGVSTQSSSHENKSYRDRNEKSIDFKIPNWIWPVSLLCNIIARIFF